MTRLAIGVGCRRGCAADTIVRLVREALSTAREGDEAPNKVEVIGLFTGDFKRAETGLHAAATALAMPLGFLDGATLEAQLGQVLTRSARVAEAVGVPSVAEMAALAGAGPGARLLGPRVARDGVTCAVAICEAEA